MKFNFDEAFREKVQIISNYCGDGDICILGDGNTITLIGKGKGTHSTIKTDYQILELGSELKFSINANLKKFNATLALYKSGTIDIIGNTIKIGLKKNIVKMLAEPDAKIEFPDEKVTIKMDMGSSLISSLEIVQYTLGADINDVKANYLYIENKKKVCSITGIDGFKACIAQFKVKNENEFNICIAKGVVEKMLKIKSTTATIGRNGSQGIATIGDFTIAFSTLNTEVALGIDLNTFTAMAPKLSIIIKKEEIAAYLSKVAVFLEEKYKQIDVDYQIEEKLIHLKFASATGIVNADIPVINTAVSKTDPLKKIRTSYSYKHLAVLVKNIIGEDIQLDFTGDLKPTIIRDISDEILFTHLLLPSRRAEENTVEDKKAA